MEPPGNFTNRRRKLQRESSLRVFPLTHSSSLRLATANRAAPSGRTRRLHDQARAEIESGGGGDSTETESEVEMEGEIVSRSSPKTPPPSRVLTGAHYLDWCIPRHIAGSRAQQRSALSVRSCAESSTMVSSPLHGPQKSQWIIDPQVRSLLLPPLLPPPVLSYPCSRANNIQEAFQSHRYWELPPPRPPSLSPAQPHSLKTLLLHHSERVCQKWEKEGQGSGPLFSNSQRPPARWFVVHPDWRREPGARRGN